MKICTGKTQSFNGHGDNGEREWMGMGMSADGDKFDRDGPILVQLSIIDPCDRRTGDSIQR